MGENKLKKQQEEVTKTSPQEGEASPPEIADVEYLRQRTAKRHPDMTFATDDDWNKQMRADADEDDKRLSEYDADAKSISELFASDPRSAEWWIQWKKNKGKSPIAAMVRVYGSDFLREGLDDPNLADQIEEAEKEYLDTITEGREYGETVQKNLDETLNTADKYAADNNLSTEEVDNLLNQVFESFKHIQLGIVTADDLDWVRKKATYEQDMQEARAEGETAGRNAKIREQLRKPKQSDGVAALNGGASNEPAADIGISGELAEFQTGRKPASEAPERRSRQRYNNY